jgi:two-component system, LytTR family, sensor histidine kinase AlgZ
MHNARDESPSTLLGNTAPTQPSTPSWGFDACTMGVAWQTVAWVQAAICLVVLLQTGLSKQWVLDVATLTLVVQINVFLWLCLLCVCQKRMPLLPSRWQWVLSITLGLGAGGLSGVLWQYLNLGQAHHEATLLTGAGASWLFQQHWKWRTRAQTPATTKAQLAQLQSRIRPHFLFNTLNSVIALVRIEPKLAEQLLQDLSELFRQALSESRRAVTLAQELDLAQRYLAIEQVRFGNRLRVQWQLDPRVNHLKLPPLLLQPLVENAVLHGVEPSTTGADIAIHTRQEGLHAIIEVSNTMPNGAGNPGAGMAQDNVRQRLMLLHGMQADFQTQCVNNVYRVQMSVLMT